jgi:hypothetical protein
MATVATNTKVEKAAWEYKDFVLPWNPGTGGYYEVDGNDQSTWLKASRQAWENNQAYILPKILEWEDNGWQPVTEVGPAAIYFRRSTGCLQVLTFTFNRFEIEEFRVKMRRRKAENSPSESLPSQAESSQKPVSLEQPKKSNTGFILFIAFVILCCCGTAALWQYGDLIIQILGQ